MNGQRELDDLIMAAAQPGNEAAALRLRKEIQTADLNLLKEAAEGFDLLFDAWDDSVGRDETKAAVCLLLAERAVLDTTTFRIALHSAIRKFLPPYISSPGVAKAVGARNPDIPVHEAAQRIRKLQRLKTNAYVFQLDSKTWSRIINVDKAVATIAVSTFATGGQISIPIASALASCCFFEPAIDITTIIGTTRTTLKNAAFYREKLRRNSLEKISESKIREIIQRMFVPNLIASDRFESWWEAAEKSADAPAAIRTFRDARSLLELQTLLKNTPPEEIKLTAEETGKLKRLFTNIRTPMTPKEQEMLACSIAQLSGGVDDAVLHELFDSLRGKVPFFPASVDEHLPLRNLEVWGRIPVKDFHGFLKAVELLYPRLEIAKLAMMLPLRCINIMFEHLSADDIFDALSASENPRSDVIMAIWKNRAKYPEEINGFVNLVQISRALSEEGLPKEWTAAQRDLKKHLFEKDDFQQFVLANAGGNIPSIVNAITRMRNMMPGECQSLLVKLARHSQALTEHIENGEGRKALEAQGEKHALTRHSPPMTSRHSYRRLVDELNNLVKVQIPENNKQIEIARGFGDFRENAEYDAAKERRRFLRRRRAELETLVATVQPIDFLEFKSDTAKAAMGTDVTLRTANGTEKVYSLVGAWDGDPDHGLVSYKTKFGEAILGARVGDPVTLPDGNRCTVAAINPLSPELAKKLSADE